ncbi:MAG: sigma-70 family RNA polymerase sigma factor [Tunicatimonas sp.]|uniref:sigma-70 family RNA polymerase sigma factor n=1 Tax=Tunicatimonas sp. TaxID=1940096 RepID=UPI003C7780BC
MKNEVDKMYDFEGDTCQRVFPLFEQYRAELVRYVRQRIDDPVQSEALVSDVLVKLYRHCEELSEVKNIRAWLYQVTRRTVYDYFREQSKLSTFPSELAEEDAYQESNVTTELASLIPLLIKCLPKKYAIPLRMSDLEGLPQQEIARQLNLSLSGAKSRIQRGRQQLKELFHQCLHLEFDQKGIPVDFQVKASCNILAESNQDAAKQSQNCAPTRNEQC